MEILHVEQRSPEWLAARRGRLTGTTASKQTLMGRRTARREFWELVAEQFDDQTPEGAPTESAMNRGVRLEPVNIARTLAALDIDPATAETEPGMWLGDGLQALSPDCHEKSDRPTWAIECKALASSIQVETAVKVAARIKIQQGIELNLPAQLGKIAADTRDYDLIPGDYQGQVLQYFAVNPDLQVVYFAMLDDRLPAPLDHLILTVRRTDVETELEAHREAVEDAEKWARTLADLLAPEILAAVEAEAAW